MDDDIRPKALLVVSPDNPASLVRLCTRVNVRHSAQYIFTERPPPGTHNVARGRFCTD